VFLWKQGIHTHDKARTTAIASPQTADRLHRSGARPHPPPHPIQRNARSKEKIRRKERGGTLLTAGLSHTTPRPVAVLVSNDANLSNLLKLLSPLLARVADYAHASRMREGRNHVITGSRQMGHCSMLLWPACTKFLQ